MEELSVSQNGGQYRSNIGGMSIGGNRQQDELGNRPQYSMPGILHFLQTEWARFEMERSQWDVERAELQVNSHISVNILTHKYLTKYLCMLAIITH